jgi:hypothetical protein
MLFLLEVGKFFLENCRMMKEVVWGYRERFEVLRIFKVLRILSGVGRRILK